MSAAARALLAALCASLAGSCGSEEHAAPDRRSARPNVLLYIVDTLRADALGAYGSPTAQSPHLDALAVRGTLFENAHANSSWTRPAVGSLLTGLYPTRHGAQRREHRLREDAATLGSLLGRHGWVTALVSTNPNVGTAFGFDAGFDVRAELFGRERPGDVLPEELITPSDVVTARTLDVIHGLRAAAGERPWCVTVLCIDPHAPHHPPAPFAPPPPRGDARGMDGRIATLRQGHLNEAQRDYARELYAAEVAFNDASFGALLAGLEQRGELANTLVVFASDHGEEFWEYGKRRGHGVSLTEEATRIPLVFAGPGVERGRRVTVDVEQVDVVPTLLGLVGLTGPAGLDGRPLLGPAAGALEPRPLYSVLDLGKHRLRAVTEAPWKLVRDTTRGTQRLYDLRQGERKAVPDPLPPEAVTARARLIARLDALEALDATPGSPADPLSPEVEASLRALGYVK